MLENNVNSSQQQQMQFQSLTPQQQEELRRQIAMQAGNPELLKENIQDTYVANRVANTTDDPKGMLWTAGLAIPSWFAIAKGMDKYAEKCRGNYEDTILYKIGHAGDRFTDWVKNSSFGKSSFAQTLKNKFDSFKGFFNKNVTEKNKVTRAFAHTPSRPDLSMVKVQMDGILGFLGDAEYKQHTEGFLKPRTTPEGLACYGAEASDISKIKAELAKAKTPEARQLVLQKGEFECLAKYSENYKLTDLNTKLNEFAAKTPKERLAILEDMKAREIGYANHAEFKQIMKHPEQNFPRIYKAAQSSNKKMFYMPYEPGGNLLNKGKRAVFNRKVYFSETANKMAGSLGEKVNTPEWQKVLKETGLDKKLPKSWLGRQMTKFNNIILEGATNRVAGGKMIAIMQAWFIGEALYKTAKAEGIGDKAKTFAERMVELIAMFACIPPALMLMHKIGGLQYAGLDKQGVEDYRKALKEHNEKAMSGQFKNKAEWKASKNALKEQLNGQVTSPFVKLCKRIGRIVTVGLEQIRPYDKKDIGVMNKEGEKVFRKGVMEKLKDLVRHPKFGIKQMAGYPMRIILGMLVIMPFFTKLAVKGCHKIFGRPKNSVLDEDKEPKEAAQQPNQTAVQNPDAIAVPPQLQNPQAIQQTQQTAAQTTNTPPGQSPTNLLNKYRNGQTNITTTTTVDTNLQKPAEPLRTYIPSPAGVQITKGEDLTAADAALRRADLAEQQALQTLKMN